MFAPHSKGKPAPRRKEKVIWKAKFERNGIHKTLYEKHELQKRTFDICQKERIWKNIKM